MAIPTAGQLVALPAWDAPHVGDPNHVGHSDTVYEILTRQGTLALRPAAGFAGRRYWATDVERLYYDNGTRWSRVGAPPSEFDPIDYGAVGDLVTDDWAAFNDMLDDIRALQVPGSDFFASRGAEIRVRPPPNGGLGYRLSAALINDRCNHWKGDTGSGYYGWSILAFDDGVTMGFRNTKPATSADGGKADWSTWDRLVVMVTGATVPGSVAFHLDTRADVTHCWITGWSSDGVYGDGATAGNNVNSSNIAFNRIDACGGYGVHIVGTNGNAGYIEHNDISNCTLGRVLEDSFLGNTQIANAGQGCGAGLKVGVGHAVQASTLLGEYIEGGQPNTLGAAVIAVGGTWGDFPIYVQGTGLFGIQGKGNIVSGGLDVRQHDNISGSLELYSPPAGAFNTLNLRKSDGTGVGVINNQAAAFCIGLTVPAATIHGRKISTTGAADGLMTEVSGLTGDGEYVAHALSPNSGTTAYVRVKAYTTTTTGIKSGALTLETPNLNRNICILPHGTGSAVLGASGGGVGFYGSAGVARQTGVAVTIAAVHAALVAVNLITA